MRGKKLISDPDSQPIMHLGLVDFRVGLRSCRVGWGWGGWGVVKERRVTLEKERH